MTPEELLDLLRNSELPELCITEEYVKELLRKSDSEILDEIDNINGFWDAQYTQHRWKTR